MTEIKILIKTDIITLLVKRIPKKGERIWIKDNFYIITEITTIFENETEKYELTTRKL